MKQHDNEQIAQVAAFFAQSAGGKIDARKLIKLFYIAQRYSLKDTGHPLYFDTMTGTNAGPIMHRTLNRIVNANFYGRYINHDAAGMVRNNMTYEPNHLDELSEYSNELIQRVWDTHGHQSDEELCYYIQNLYSEVKPGNIAYVDILKCVGYTDDLAEHLVSEIMFFEDLDRQFNNYEKDIQTD